MDRLELQKLRDLPIEGVAERLGMQIVRHKALCPFHDDHHASLSFSMRRNTFRCFACGAHGGTIDLVMKRQNLGFKEACEWLGGNHALELPGYHVDNDITTTSPPGRFGGATSTPAAIPASSNILFYCLRPVGFSLRSGIWMSGWSAGAG